MRRPEIIGTVEQERSPHIALVKVICDYSGCFRETDFF